MKTLRIAALPDGTHRISPLALPFIRRSGIADAENYRKQSRGETSAINFNPNAADALRAITLTGGRFTGLASDRQGSLLTFVVAGAPTLAIGDERRTIEPGDIFLTDAESAAQIALEIGEETRLVQIVVDAAWPGDGAELPDEGTVLPRRASGPKLKRIYKGEDDRAYYSEFAELFGAPSGQWSEPKPIVGFRILRWEDGEMDWHPCVTNQLAIISAGELEFEVGGDGGSTEIFHAGDVCIAEDKTGEGHFNRARGVAFVTIMVVDQAHIWPSEHSHPEAAPA